jgi:SSS family solute:Na+ symporter
MNNGILIVLLVVFLAGNVFAVKRGYAPQNGLHEYSVAGRSTGTFIFLMSFIGRWIPGSVCTVWFVLAAERGVYAQYLTVYTIGAVVMLRLFGVPLWRLGKRYNLETQADFIELRYGSTSFKRFFSLVTFIFWFPWVILELKTIGQALTATSNYSLEYNMSIIIVTMFILIPCFYGGVRSVNNGSVVQTLVFIVFVCAGVYDLICAAFGGFFPMYARMAAEAPEVLTVDFAYPHRFELFSAVLAGTLGSIFWPGMFCHIYAAKNEDVIRKSCLFTLFLALPAFILTLSLGMSARLIPGLRLSDAMGLFRIAEAYDNKIVLAMLGVGVTATCMTMCAPMFNVAGIMIAKDMLPALRALSRADTLKSAKVCTVAVGLVALWLATIEFPNLVSLVMLMYSFIIQASAPILLGLRLRRSNLYGAVAGMAAGLFATLVFSVFPQFVDGMNGLSAGIAGLAVNAVVHIAVSLLTPGQRETDGMFGHANSYLWRR